MLHPDVKAWLGAPALAALLWALAVLAQPAQAAPTQAAPAQAAPAQAAPPIQSVLDAARQQAAQNRGILPVDQAFRISAEAAGPDRVRIHWEIAQGDYLYRSRIKVKAAATGVQLGQLQLPQGENKTDDYFGTQQIYHVQITAILPVIRAATAGGALPLSLDVSYQGCDADAGVCYPPQTRTLNVTLPPGGGAGGTVGGAAQDAAGTGSSGAGGSTFLSEQDRLAGLVAGGNLALVLSTFFGLGLLLAFTPCVLPMVPILSGIIAGHGPGVTTRRAFTLSATYVLGMAVTYTVAGVAAAAAGSHVQQLFEQSWVIALFALLFIVLALSMFGLFTLQMPAAVQTRLAALSNRQAAGRYGGVAVMGALSALIVTTCVAPPLVATLAVIGRTGNIGRGAAALFSMSLGMGAPLLLVGASAGKLLPKAGPWMDTVKRLFGALMLLVAAWMLQRILPERAALLLWAVPAAAAAVVLWQAEGRRRTWVTRTAAVACGLYAVTLLVGAGLGATSPLAPLSRPRPELVFHSIRSVADLDREVAQAAASGRPVMLDFYADWCASCKEMQADTFTDPRVAAALHDVVLLRADVTANDADDQALLKRFGIFGPPTIAFYGADGREHANYRVVGFMTPAQFARTAQAALARQPVTAPPASPARASPATQAPASARVNAVPQPQAGAS
ncbi:MAG TPA: protein-disulfide reductase DsbD [Steroidobacteraceae bacterium]|nr:protein-disulfide reductase DsbD [Steroidobacteraceae bacterium]